MKLTGIDLTRFGHFADAALELGDGTQLHVLFGRNAAGKSTIAAAIEYALFDWPAARSERTYAFEFPTNKLRIGMQLTAADATPLDFVRRKGNGTTVLDPQSGTASDELAMRLQRALSGMTRDQWRLRHGLTKARLLEGGRALQASGGDLGAVLAAAQSGVQVLREVLDDVVRRRDAIDNGKQSGALVDAVRAFEAAAKDAKDASMQAASYSGDVARRELLDARFEQLREQIAELRAERALLEYLEGTLGDIRHWEELAAQIEDATRGTSTWSRAEHDQWRSAADGERSERTQLEQDQPRLHKLREQRDALTIDDRLLALHDQADSLRQRIAQAAAARDELPGLARDVQAARETLAGLGIPSANVARDDGGALADAVDRALLVNVDELRGLRASVEERVRALGMRAAALPGCDLDLDGVRSLALPADADITALAHRVTQLDADIAHAQAEIQRAIDHTEARAKQLRDLETDGELPSVEHLAQLREHRDAAWVDVRAYALRASDAPEDVSDAVHTVEADMREADSYADHLARESERAGQARQLRQQDAGDQERQQVFTAQLADLQRARVELLDTDWAQLWASAGIAASSMPAMQAFAVEVAAIRAAALSVDEDVAASRAGTERIRTLTQELNRVVGEPPTAEQEADELSAFELLRARARRLRDDAASKRAQAATAQTKLQAAQRDEQRARDVLASFVSDVAALLDAAGTPVSHEPTPDDASTALTQLWQRVVAVERAAELDRGLAEQVRELDARIAERTAKIASLREKLDALRTNVGAPDDAAVMALDAQWIQAQGLIDERRAIEDRLRDAVAASVPELIELRDASDVALSVRIERIDESCDALAMEQSATKAERDELVIRIRDLQTSTALADAVERRTSARARIEELVPLVQRLALEEQMLREFIEQHARDSRGPLIGRAGEYFARITCGEFERVDLDDAGSEQLVLVGVPADGRINVRVGDLSEGTADQLYLALRLAAVALERETGGEAMPLIIDDVLASFDDDRARATLVLLAELAAQGVQVLFLTHHRHLVDLATDALMPDTLHVHRLDELAVPAPSPAI